MRDALQIKFLKFQGRGAFAVTNNFGVMPSVGSDSHLPLERLRSTVHSAIIGESPMDGKPSYLPLERLRSAGADKERVLVIGVIPIFLYHGSDSLTTVGHT